MKNNRIPAEQYMAAANKVKRSLKHGEIKLFLDQHKDIGRVTLTNAMKGFYLAGKTQVPYQRMDILDLLVEFINQREQKESKVMTNIINL